MNAHQIEAIANADAHLNNAVLPTYSELLKAVATRPLYIRLHDMLVDATDNRRLTEDQIPDDYQAIVRTLVDIAGTENKIDAAAPGALPSNALVDAHLEAVLRASGSSLRHYSMAKTIEDMRAAMRTAMMGVPAGWDKIEADTTN